MLSGASDYAPLPDVQVPLEASSPTLLAGALPSHPPASMSRGLASSA